MPRVPDVPCAGCGTLLWSGTTSLPAGQRRCRSCRATDSASPDAMCAHCARPFRSKRLSSGGRTETCGLSCAQLRYQRAKGVPVGGDRGKRKASWRAKNHRRRAHRRAAFDQVTPEYERVLRAKAKRCPLCMVRMTDVPYLPTSKELDHIVPIIVGGTHTIGNVRIICRLCNVRRPRDGSDYVGPITLWSVT